MHFALLLGYGASAVNPYLAIETLEDMFRDGTISRRVIRGTRFSESYA